MFGQIKLLYVKEHISCNGELEPLRLKIRVIIFSNPDLSYNISACIHNLRIYKIEIYI